MLDKKTKEELMQLPKEEIIEVYEMLYELYDELGDRVGKVIEYIKENYSNPDGEIWHEDINKILIILEGSDK